MTPPMDEPQTRMTDEQLHHANAAARAAKYMVREGTESWPLILALTEELIELRAARTRSVEPPREMVERANEWLAWMGWEASPVNAPQSLAALLTSVRSQAIELCAGVAGQEGYGIGNNVDLRKQIAREIRTLK